MGKKKEGETSLGSFSKGTRNDNGESLVQFCEKINKLFLTNKAFKKASRHITTWVGSWRDKDNKLMPIYNQIDFIICPPPKQNQKHIIKEAQSYSGITLSPDHKLVKTTFRLSNVNTWKQIK